MDATRPPNFSGNYPLGGAQIGPAWRAAWVRLATAHPRWVVSDDLAVVMESATGVADKTARSLLSAARRARVVEVRYRSVGTPRRRRAEYRPRQDV